MLWPYRSVSINRDTFTAVLDAYVSPPDQQKPIDRLHARLLLTFHDNSIKVASRNPPTAASTF